MNVMVHTKFKFILPWNGLQKNLYYLMVMALGHSVEWPLVSARKFAIVSIFAEFPLK